jgi:molybdenum cofactor cytidylyltransferase
MTTPIPTLEKGARRFAAVVLAAGGSVSRGGTCPLTPYLGRTLVEHAARTALDSGACEVVVVAGEHATEIRRRLRRLPVRVVENREWREGISSSIRAGVAGLTSEPAAAIVCLCDQPKITADHLRALGERALAGDGARSGPTPIVASSYDGILGAPAAFAASMFPDLLALRGRAGARDLIRGAHAQVEAIHFADANEGVDPLPISDPPPRPRRKNILTGRYEPARAPRAPPSRRQIPVAV